MLKENKAVRYTLSELTEPIDWALRNLQMTPPPLRPSPPRHPLYNLQHRPSSNGEVHPTVAKGQQIANLGAWERISGVDIEDIRSIEGYELRMRVGPWTVANEAA